MNRISQDDQTILDADSLASRCSWSSTRSPAAAARMREGIEILDGFQIRRAAVEANIPCLTSLDTARALVEALRAGDETLTLPFPEYRRE